MEVPEDVKQILAPGEVVQLYIQRKINHPKFNIESLVITNARVILRQPRVPGVVKNDIDYRYQDILNVELDKGFLRSAIRLILRTGGEPLSLPDLTKGEASEAYGIIKENLSRIQGGTAPAPGAPNPSANKPKGFVCKTCGYPAAIGQSICSNCGARL
jgi:hypothetical protein